jgi:hypothetical protein
LIGKGELGLSIKTEILTNIFLIQILFKIVVLEFGFLVPVAEFGFGGESILDCVVVHFALIGWKLTLVISFIFICFME